MAKKAKKAGGAKPAARSAGAAAGQYCYNFSPDPNWVIRCDRDPTTGKCTSNNCIRIPASSVPQATTPGSARAKHLRSFNKAANES
jgi:hypothetical protein